VAGFAQCIDDLAAIERYFKPLKCETLAGPLRPYYYRQISKSKVYISEVCKIFDLKRYWFAFLAMDLGFGQFTAP